MVSALAANPLTFTVSQDEWQQRLLSVHGSVDSGELIQNVFSLMEATVSCDFSLVVLHAVDSLPMVARDSTGREFSYQFMEQSYRHNPATAFLMANPGVPMLTTREQLPAGDAIFEHPFYEHGMKPMGFRHCLALFFWDYLPLVAHQVFAVFRREGQPDFTAEEEQSMLALHPHINTALKRVRRQPSPATDKTTPDSAVISWDLSLGSVSDNAKTLLQAWSGSGLPQEVVSHCQQLKEQWRRMLQLDPAGKVSRRIEMGYPPDARILARLDILPPQETSVAHPSFLLSFHRTLDSSVSAADALCTLSPAELETAMLAASCLDNQQIADRLRINVSAVKSRLHSTFKKLQLQHRSQLVALLAKD